MTVAEAERDLVRDYRETIWRASRLAARTARVPIASVEQELSEVAREWLSEHEDELLYEWPRRYTASAIDRTIQSSLVKIMTDYLAASR